MTNNDEIYDRLGELSLAIAQCAYQLGNSFDKDKLGKVVKRLWAGVSMLELMARHQHKEEEEEEEE